MNLDRFVSERSASWAELDDLVRRAGSHPAALGPDAVRRLGTLYRAAAADLATARRAFPGDPLLARLGTLVRTAYATVYAHRSEASAGDFVRRGFWRLVLADPPTLFLAALLLAVPAVAAFVLALRNPAAVANFLPANFSAVGQPRGSGPELGVATSTAFATQIFTNNIYVAFAALAGGLTAGVLTTVSLLYNGILLGGVAGLAAQGGQLRVVVPLLVPHGLLELSCIVLAAGAGFRMARAIVEPGHLRRTEALAAVAPQVVLEALGIAAYLVLAGLVEGFVTPRQIGLGPALVVGTVLAAALWVPVALWGRRAGRGRTPT